MIAFHGYAQDKSVFEALLPSLEQHYTIYSIDLPFHGNTYWAEPFELDQNDLESLAISFIKEINVEGMVSLIGYSIGGNYVLGLAQKCPQIVDEIWLIAADGLGPKPGFNFITKTIIGRSFFLGFIHFPYLVFAGIWALEKLKIMPIRVAKFFMFNIDTRKKRKLLYLRWRSVSRIRGNIRLVKNQIRLYKIPTYLIFGKNDGVIPVVNAEKFSKGLSSARVLVTDQGHQMLDPETNQYIDIIIKERE